jgi:soluble lytic murein transglycosylase-like protein
MCYFMRKANFAAKVFQLAVPPVLAAFVCSGPAFAHSHRHVPAHAYRAPMKTNNVAPAASFDTTSSMAAALASAAGIPVSLVERVIRRESGGNARAVHAGNYGLMQIRLSTARAMGYTGSAAR